jgi:nucleotide-binding universal stress UspA family protein
VVPIARLPDVPDAAATAAQEYLERISSRLAGTGLVSQTALLHGDPPTEILQAAEVHNADLVVMSIHGRSGIGRWLYCSVADAVIRLASLPVMLVPPDLSVAWPTSGPARILVPLDGSPLSEMALGPAMELAGCLRAELLLVQVVPWPPIVYGDPVELLPHEPEEQLAEARSYLDELAARVRQTGVSVRHREDVGQTAAAAIVRLVQEEHVDLVAMAMHGRSGLARVVLGSTTTGTLQRAGVPVLVVRPTGPPVDPPLQADTHALAEV